MPESKNPTNTETIKVTLLKNTPPPPRTRIASSKYPWGEVGEDRPMIVTGRTTKQFSAVAYAAAKRLGKKFSVRPYELDGEAAVGVWLV